MARDFGFGDLKGHVGPRFTNEPLFDLARGKEPALSSGKRRIVYTDLHGDRGGINLDKAKRLVLLTIGNRLADKNVLKTPKADDVSFGCALHLNFLQTLVAKNGGDIRTGFPAGAVEANDALAEFDLAAGDPSVGNPAQIVTVIEIRDEELKITCVRLLRRRDVSDDGLEEGKHRVAGIIKFPLGESLLRTGIEMGEIELLIRGFQFQEELENHIEHLVWPSIFPIDLVDDDDGFKVVFHRLAQDKFRLRLRSIVSVYDEKNAIHHLHDAFDLASEIGMSRRIHDIDAVSIPAKSRVLGADCDSLFSFKIHGIHHALIHFLVGAESS